ncbi:E3 ubiquitin-protein ligase TRIM71-like [Mercenaria mercenaria]|uniref:E3 ubiquitin-protein ligase TRIM71-like n=1 Tax=Mercenaria mercenaria TaxID=6596 RepID=UPI00234F2A47|nr:E3 ubiquitin-protein ligase TRIM71-like [Mercenaria mercenaria]XP_053401548.1 E3 ubiquitin-protein ligase TRIM71-like [Mercenaria mercenaria]
MAVPGKKAPQNLSSTMSRGSGEDFEVFCLPCDRDDLRLPAAGYCVDCEEHLCDSCFNTHRRPKPLRHHQPLDKAHMPKSPTLSTTSSSTHVGQSDDLTDPCTKHKKEIIKFYCNDHKALLCVVCVTLEHTPTSCRVDYIPDISGQAIDSTGSKETFKKLGKIAEECQKISSDLKQMVAKSNTSLTDVLAEISKLRQEINQRLDGLEKEAKDAAKTLQQENATKLRTTKTACDNAIQSIKAASDTIRHLNTTKKANKLFIELNNAEQVFQENVNKMSQLTTAEDIKEYMFKPGPAMETLLQNEKSLGTLRAKLLKQSSLSSTTTLIFSTISPPRNISINTSSDGCDCSITGMTTSSPNQIFLADYSNNSVKMVDTNSLSIRQQRLDSSPWDIKIISRDELVVTMPAINTIQFLSFSSNRLFKKHTLKVDGKCYGICYYQEKFAVTFLDPGTLKIMDMKGTVLVNITKNSSGKNIFIYPEYVSTNSHSIYVSDWGKHEVIWLNWQGELLGSYGGLGLPRGLDMLTDGSIFVSDSRYDKCNILNITGDCKESKTILKDFNYPKAICWCDASKTLHVSSTTISDEGRNNLIKIYKMS